MESKAHKDVTIWVKFDNKEAERILAILDKITRDMVIKEMKLDGANHSTLFSLCKALKDGLEV